MVNVVCLSLEPVAQCWALETACSIFPNLSCALFLSLFPFPSPFASRNRCSQPTSISRFPLTLFGGCETRDLKRIAAWRRRARPRARQTSVGRALELSDFGAAARIECNTPRAVELSSRPTDHVLQALCCGCRNVLTYTRYQRG